MAIVGDLAARVRDLQHVAIAVLLAGELNAAVARCAYGRARGSGVVDAFVRTNRVENGMATVRVELVAETKKHNQRTQKRAIHADAFRRVVMRGAVRVDVT